MSTGLTSGSKLGAWVRRRIGRLPPPRTPTPRATVMANAISSVIEQADVRTIRGK